MNLHDLIATSTIGKTLHLGFLQTDFGKWIFGALIVGGFYIVGRSSFTG